MKKSLFKIFVPVLTLALTLTNFSSVTGGDFVNANLNKISRDNQVIYAKPTVSPSGNSLTVKSALNFNYGSYTWIENDDWDWDTMSSEYKIIQENSNNKFSLKQVGGNYHPSFECWIPAVNISGASGITLGVDFSKLKNPNDIKIQLRLQTSPNGLESDPAALTKTKTSAGNYYVYDYQAGDWAEYYSADGISSLPAGYKGYVYLPLTLFKNLTSQNVGIDGCYVQMYHLDIWTADGYDCTSEIILDDFDLVSQGDLHTHQFLNYGVVEASCVEQGVSVQKCDCGQVKWLDKVSPLGHTVGDKYYHTPNTSFASCLVCNRLEYYDQPSAMHLDNAKTINYNYLAENLTNVSAQYPSGYVLQDNDILYQYKSIVGFDEYQFLRFTQDEVGLDGCNLIGHALHDNLTVYAQYNLSSYDGEKFRAMYSDISLNGGPYAPQQHLGKVIFMGNSNYSLWHNMEGWYASNGIPVLNNSVAGSTSYNYVEYLEELILMYQPKIVVTGISSNDLAYHQMTDKAILGNMKKVYDRIQEIQPGTPVILIAGGLLPGRPEYFTAIRRINVKLKEFCNQNDFAYYYESDPDAAWEALLQYPNGWESWTHRNQESCQKTLGDNLLPLIRTIMQEHGINY